MKTSKMILPIAALLVSAVAFGQKANSKGQVKKQERVYQTTTNRETARTNGAVNANRHANTNAQQRANENSVLNGTTGTEKKYKSKKTATDRRKYVTKRKANK